jgi:hypothetical protein
MHQARPSASACTPGDHGAASGRRCT